jgi:hypothetical protein
VLETEFPSFLLTKDKILIQYNLYIGREVKLIEKSDGHENKHRGRGYRNEGECKNPICRVESTKH